MTTPPPADARSAIYDLGYRRYDGERLGRRHAVVTLYLESLRGAFGLGRSAAAKVAPAILIAVALVPAAVQLVIGALFPGQIELVRASEYYGLIKYVLALYCAVIAPDIAGREQRNHLITLYFARAISRTDYAIGKFGAMMTAMLLITLVPQLVLFLGNGLNTQELGTYAANEWDQLPAIAGTALLGSALIASLGVAIAAHTPQRAFATVGIVAAFLLPIAIANIVVAHLDTATSRYAIFASPLDVLDGLTAWMFRAEVDHGSLFSEAGHGLWTYGLAAAVITLLGMALIVRRYRTVQA